VPNSNPGLLEILKILTRHRVEFIVVGGISAVFHGAAVMTQDLDVVHSRSSDNISRLLSALDELDATYRMQPERKLRPKDSHLAGPGHQLLITKFGMLDVLGMIGDSRTWVDLQKHTQLMEIGPDASVHVLNLDTLIEIKERLGRPKDLAVLPILRDALEENGRKS
jgi:hypothetical protein